MVLPNTNQNQNQKSIHNEWKVRNKRGKGKRKIGRLKQTLKRMKQHFKFWLTL
jgi:hypothetical protein